MTYTRATSSSPTTMAQRTQQLHTAQLLRGPAQRALAYTFAYAYTAKCDVLQYLSTHDLSLHFTEPELQQLSKARTARLYTIPALYKIFRFCCGDKLLEYCRKEWDTSAPATPVTPSSSLESHITFLQQCHTALTLQQEAGQEQVLVAAILGLVQKVGEVLGVSKWKQQHDALKQTIADILEDVVPGEDVRERVANAARLEAGMRCEALTEAVAALVLETRRSSCLEEEDWALLQDLPCNITAVADAKELNRHAAAVAPEERSVASEDVLAVLHQSCSESIDGKKICCISGEHGVGKSSLAAKFVVSHCQQDDTIKHLVEYDHVVIVSGREIEQTSITKWVGNTKSQRNDLSNFIDDYWSVVEAFLPRCCAKYGVKNVGQFLTAKKILFIVDDAEELSENKVKELVLFFGQIVFDSSVLIFGNCESIAKIKFSFISFSSVQHLNMTGISKDNVMEIGIKFKENIKSGKKKLQKSFKDAIKSNMNRIGRLLEYPELLHDVVSMFRSRSMLVKEVSTATELLWNWLSWKSNEALQASLTKDVGKRRQWLRWQVVTGNNCLYCLKANSKLNSASLEEIKEFADKVFSNEESDKLMSAFFKKRLAFYTDSFVSLPCSTSLPILQYFSSYYIINKLLTEEESICSFLPKTEPEVIIGFLAGHLKRWHESSVGDEVFEEMSQELVQQLIETIVDYDDGKTEDVEFLLKVATEFKSSHKLIQLLVNVTEYSEEWDLNFCFLQQKTLEMMMQHVAPVRIILRADKYNIQNYEQIAVLKFLGRVPISVWFESRDQFQYGSKKQMDKIIRPLLHKDIYCRVDLLSGCLSTGTLLDLPDYKPMTHLVMLALRVTDEVTLSTALTLPSHLPKLLWFELKIDMSIDNVVLTALPSMKVEMFDVYLRDLDDLAIPQITGLLTKLHKRYSGIHLDQTSLSPESIYTLLKELKRRDIILCAAPESIDKYRRWYYPLLSSLPTETLLSDQEVKSILGFEDRHFYSEHKIQSSTFVRSIDAWNLTSYLEELKEIKYFTYNADNLSFIKTLEGEVETEHHSTSAVKVDTTGAIL